MRLEISKKKISSTSLISMTDVMFLMLIFMILASNFTIQTGLPLKLPASVSQESQVQQVLQIQYLPDKTIIFEGKTYTLVELGPALQKEFMNKEQIVRLAADRATPLQDVITLMDVIRSAGFERIFVGTEPIKE
ncbi:MAG: biopolymer transporter ExbD [Candidatus Cloacimonadaceae bacterium]|jgi:biopolymer transport protein ExbD|nr:biopolymer transporter ExbD [Candidatus Cloacimonadota bacterium]MCB5258596.1 biopolymer transporter ExbD [Candidatus Cloacimonadota bacterium]MDD5625279.1 biopolymer transporter ExbD [Candidatus Cloacimonadota bacterium]MDY0111955.1 biopolymer transporter ExbD [Candidatus Syntrophosphaera sp.]